ncbi:hypothetical protein BDQ12DRAFT_717428 [Crucibulum laeve]|uniref:J domain-containing protein n=1 Tax=Crucibulum laeve TaxID=68775 RepID=A0A5C3MFV9_9AGAR|nr:hypothetical protein BDQ12DRAFT_717428 [Crucibulum laeve]
MASVFICRRLPSRLALELHFSSTCSNARRQISTTTAGPSNAQFPYPPNRNPTPHQIFHLPRNATEGDIKARYYDLVRIYHPDKTDSTTPLDIAHARFQAITAAYDSLRGKTPLVMDGSPANGFATQDRSYQTTAAFRAAQRRRQELYTSGAADERWKDKIILAGVIMTVVIVVAQTATTRRDAMAEIYAKTRHPHVYSQQRAHDERLALSSDATNVKESQPRG